MLSNVFHKMSHKMKDVGVSGHQNQFICNSIKTKNMFVMHSKALKSWLVLKIEGKMIGLRFKVTCQKCTILKFDKTNLYVTSVYFFKIPTRIGSKKVATCSRSKQLFIPSWREASTGVLVTLMHAMMIMIKALMWS